MIFRVRPQPLISGYAQGLPWYAWQGTDGRQPGTTNAWELIGAGPVDLQASLSVALTLAHNYTNISRHASMIWSSMYVFLVLYYIILFAAALLGVNLIPYLDSNNSLVKKDAHHLHVESVFHNICPARRSPDLSHCVGQMLFLVLQLPPTIKSHAFGWCEVSRQL